MFTKLYCFFIVKFTKFWVKFMSKSKHPDRNRFLKVRQEILDMLKTIDESEKDGFNKFSNMKKDLEETNGMIMKVLEPETLFYDPYANRFFYASIRKIEEAKGTLNDLYKSIGIPDIGEAGEMSLDDKKELHLSISKTIEDDIFYTEFTYE